MRWASSHNYRYHCHSHPILHCWCRLLSYYCCVFVLFNSININSTTKVTAFLRSPAATRGFFFRPSAATIISVPKRHCFILPHYATTRNKMESFPLPLDTTTSPVAVLTQAELRHKRLIKLGVVAQERTTAEPALPQRRFDEQLQQPRKRRAVESKAAPNTNSAVIDLCDDSSGDDDGAARKQATESTRNSATFRAAATTTTVARPLALAVDSSSEEEEDDEAIVESTRRRDPEEKRRAKKRAATTSSSSTIKSQTIAKAKSNTAFQDPSSRSKPFRWQVATYNVWFGPNQGGDPHPDERMSALCRELLPSSSEESTQQQQPPLLFCGFQEVVPSLNVPIQRAMQAAGYKVFSQPGMQYGCALAVKCRGPGAVTVLDAGWQGFTETIMGRGYLHVRARLPNMTADGTEQQILFTTTHLESWAGKDHTGKVQRAKQLQEMEAFCNQQLALHPNLQAAIITGDLNWDDERRNPNDAEMSTVLRTEWKDAWSETKSQPKETCYTYDGKMNPMLGNNLRRRFDRVLIRCRENKNKNKQLFDPPCVVPTTTRLIGTQAIPGLTFRKENPYTKTSREYAVAPSDHFGLVAHLQSNNF
jgi:hypothetical protein